MGASGASAPAGGTVEDILTSRWVRLNGGAPLAVQPSGAVDPSLLQPLVVAAGEPLLLPPISYAFLVFDANVSACA